MNKKINIGLIGLGTVGQGVVKVLSKFDNIDIITCAVKNLNKKRQVEVKNLTTDVYEVVNNPDVDIVVEVAGGVGVKDALMCAIKNKKHIVTANKELLARYGAELFDEARNNSTSILYEAAVAGGIPIVQPIKTSLKANDFDCVAGILNGTTNYILTKMDTLGASYQDVLKEAQELGYAETDPTGDVEGFDAAYKITTLATIAFKKRIKLDNVYREGITKIRSQDMKAANDLGYKIKLIASASIDENNNADVRVHPMLISQNTPLAHINYVTNAVRLSGHPIGDITLSGPGAGEFPTASSVVGDILAIAAEFGKTDYLLPMMRCRHEGNANCINIKDTVNKYYLSINAKNNKGVIGTIGKICAENDISLQSIVQRGVDEDNTANITVITELALEKNMRRAIEDFEKDKFINKVNSMIRVQV